MLITGMEPITRRPLYASLGPILSQSQPIASLATIVMATEAMIVLPTWAFVSPRSSRTMTIRGAMPNQPKNARKNANQVRWNVRI